MIRGIYLQIYLLNLKTVKVRYKKNIIKYECINIRL